MHVFIHSLKRTNRALSLFANMHKPWPIKAQTKSQIPQGFWLLLTADNVQLCLLKCMRNVYLFVKKHTLVHLKSDAM